MLFSVKNMSKIFFYLKCKKAIFINGLLIKVNFIAKF